MSGTSDTKGRTVVISASLVKRKCRVLATRKGELCSSPLCQSSVNVGYLRHERVDSGHLRFTGQASMSGTCDTEGRRVIISVSGTAKAVHRDEHDIADSQVFYYRRQKTTLSTKYKFIVAIITNRPTTLPISHSHMNQNMSHMTWLTQSSKCATQCFTITLLLRPIPVACSRNHHNWGITLECTCLYASVVTHWK